MKPEPYRGIVEIRINEDSEEKAANYLEFLLADFYHNRSNFEYEIVAIVPPGESALIMSLPDGADPGEFGQFVEVDDEVPFEDFDDGEDLLFEEDEEEDDGDLLDDDRDAVDNPDDVDSDGDVVAEDENGFSGPAVVETRVGG